MRRILIDRARKRQVRAASGLDAPEELHESQLELGVPDAELLSVNEVLDRLAKVDADAAELVKLRYFVGMSMQECAEASNVPLRRSLGTPDAFLEGKVPSFLPPDVID